MYFNPRVKERKEDFFDFEVIQEDLRGAIENKLTPLIAIFGLRRTGKTSLIHVVLNSLKKKHLWLDSRNIYSQADFFKTILEKTEALKLFKLKNLSIRGFEFNLDYSKQGLEYLNKHKITLVIDEAQLLKKIHLDRIIAYIYDNYPRIKIILSGSEAGMLRSFLGQGNARAPLYGRAVYEIQTSRLDKEKAKLFFHLGAKQAKISLKEEQIEEAIDRLDGIIGWLTKYGWYRLKFSHREALLKTINEGKLVIKEEFMSFAARAEGQYKKILKAIKGGAGWEEIKNKVAISDKQLYSMLKRLQNYSFIEKTEKVYAIADPLLEAAF